MTLSIRLAPTPMCVTLEVPCRGAAAFDIILRSVDKACEEQCSASMFMFIVDYYRTSDGAVFHIAKVPRTQMLQMISHITTKLVHICFDDTLPSNVLCLVDLGTEEPTNHLFDTLAMRELLVIDNTTTSDSKRKRV